MSNGPVDTVKVRVDIDLDDDAIVGTRVHPSARGKWKNEFGFKKNAIMHIPVAVYYAVLDAWPGFLVYAGKGDPPPRPW